MKLQPPRSVEKASTDNQPVIIPSIEPEEPVMPELDPDEVPDEFPFIRPMFKRRVIVKEAKLI